MQSHVKTMGSTRNFSVVDMILQFWAKGITATLNFEVLNLCMYVVYDAFQLFCCHSALRQSFGGKSIRFSSQTPNLDNRVRV